MFSQKPCLQPRLTAEPYHCTAYSDQSNMSFEQAFQEDKVHIMQDDDGMFDIMGGDLFGGAPATHLSSEQRLRYDVGLTYKAKVTVVVTSCQSIDYKRM
eukprot:m.329908 g.329908  ORF g.329908 m.329908 type:complete len:99 (-) comp16042_c1_seq4:128-424(-)